MEKVPGFTGCKFPYLLILVIFQSLSYTNTIYEVLFLFIDPDGVLIWWQL